MTKTLLLATLTLSAALSFQTAARAQDSVDPAPGHERLMIVNGNSGRVVYDDGRNDLYCVTRRYTAGYDEYGQPVRRRSMKCR